MMEENKMSTAILEQIAEQDSVKLCQLKEVSYQVHSHPDRALLLLRWDTCCKCEGYDTKCPGYR